LQRDVLFSCGAVLQRVPGAPHSRGFPITHNDAPQTVGLLWTSDQLVAEISTSQHTALTTKRHPCLRQDSNPQFQQARGRRHAPYIARPLGPAYNSVFLPSIPLILSNALNDDIF